MDWTEKSSKPKDLNFELSSCVVPYVIRSSVEPSTGCFKKLINESSPVTAFKSRIALMISLRHLYLTWLLAWHLVANFTALGPLFFFVFCLFVCLFLCGGLILIVWVLVSVVYLCFFFSLFKSFVTPELVLLDFECV